MVKRTIKETVTEYNKDGQIVKQTVTETTEDDDTKYWTYNIPPVSTTLMGAACNTSNAQLYGAGEDICRE